MPDRHLRNRCDSNFAPLLGNFRAGYGSLTASAILQKSCNCWRNFVSIHLRGGALLARCSAGKEAIGALARMGHPKEERGRLLVGPSWDHTCSHI